ncbi:hypothetical protein EVAR_77504_1 [Eumeta japonica]|uniref:Uncharacterized protein n=1 Tax=Eumeta variegata TaxID=151549 RepID=A0A4C1T6C9_EUMVA|nr:hypothetical protein EVAR_77504_1 [Eumeta japonica]
MIYLYVCIVSDTSDERSLLNVVAASVTTAISGVQPALGQCEGYEVQKNRQSELKVLWGAVYIPWEWGDLDLRQQLCFRSAATTDQESYFYRIERVRVYSLVAWVYVLVRQEPLSGQGRHRMLVFKIHNTLSASNHEGAGHPFKTLSRTVAVALVESGMDHVSVSNIKTSRCSFFQCKKKPTKKCIGSSGMELITSSAGLNHFLQIFGVPHRRQKHRVMAMKPVSLDYAPTLRPRRQIVPLGKNVIFVLSESLERKKPSFLFIIDFRPYLKEAAPQRLLMTSGLDSGARQISSIDPPAGWDIEAMKETHRHLKLFGRTHKTCRIVPYELNEVRAIGRIEACKQLFALPKDVRRCYSRKKLDLSKQSKDGKSEKCPQKKGALTMGMKMLDHILRKSRGIRSKNSVALNSYYAQHLVQNLHRQTTIYSDFINNANTTKQSLIGIRRRVGGGYNGIASLIIVAQTHPSSSALGSVKTIKARHGRCARADVSVTDSKTKPPLNNIQFANVHPTERHLRTLQFNRYSVAAGDRFVFVSQTRAGPSGQNPSVTIPPAPEHRRAARTNASPKSGLCFAGAGAGPVAARGAPRAACPYLRRIGGGMLKAGYSFALGLSNSIAPADGELSHTHTHIAGVTVVIHWTRCTHVLTPRPLAVH